jgi:hypothetical protein
MLLYSYGNTLIYLYLDLQSEYYQLSLHFIDLSLITNSHKSGFRSITYRIRCRTLIKHDCDQFEASFYLIFLILSIVLPGGGILRDPTI